MNKVKIALLVILSAFFIFMGVVATFDWQAAKRRESHKKWRLTQQEIKQQGINMQKVHQQLEKFKEEKGYYPASLEELKEAGYEFPEEPTPPGWRWGYQLLPSGPDVIPMPEL